MFELTLLSKDDFIAKYPFSDERNRKNIRNLQYIPGVEVNVRIESTGESILHWILFNDVEIFDQEHPIYVRFFDLMDTNENHTLPSLSPKYVYTFVIENRPPTLKPWQKERIILKYMYEVQYNETMIHMKNSVIETTTRIGLKYHLQTDMAYDLHQVSPDILDHICTMDDCSWQGLKNIYQLNGWEDDIRTYIHELLVNSDLITDYGQPGVLNGWIMIHEGTGEYTIVYHSDYDGPKINNLYTIEDFVNLLNGNVADK